MSVYVDPLFEATCAACPNARRWCHMFADTPAELHAMAEAIGMRRSWFQERPNRERHYDLVPRKRAKAIALGAVEIASTRAYLRTKEASRSRKR